MSHLVSIVLLTSLLFSCNKSDDSQTMDPSSNDLVDVGEVPTEAFTFDSNIRFLNTTATDEAKFEQAIDLIKRVVASEEFKSRVINHFYNGVRTFVDNGGLSNEEIYQKIIDGAESLRPLINNTMDMEVELYYADTTTIGYTYPSVTQIWVNTKYFNRYSYPSVANNLFHEWLHKLGFTHAVSYSSSRDYSVPYAVGKMISSIGNTL